MLRPWNRRFPFVSAAVLAASIAAAAAQTDRTRQIEEDWLDQARLSAENQRALARLDAAAGCDGIKDGAPGFQTAVEVLPWWQVDLGTVHELDRALVWNPRANTGSRGCAFLVLLSDDGRQWRRIFREEGSIFRTVKRGQPLVVGLNGQKARFVRTQIDGRDRLRLEEVEVYGRDDPNANLALRRLAAQSSHQQPQPARKKGEPPPEPSGGTVYYPIREAIERGRRLARERSPIPLHRDWSLDLRGMGAPTADRERELGAAAERLAELQGPGATEAHKELYLAVRRTVRKLVFADPLLDFDRLVFLKRQPNLMTTMSLQYHSWWARPGGGVCVLEGLKTASPRVRCLTEGKFPEGNFLGLDLSWDGKRLLLAFCRTYEHVAAIKDKTVKHDLPEDSFYNVYEMNVDGTGLRQLTRGRYDDFDARYLPDGRIVFLSTRRSRFVQLGAASAQATLTATLPDSYVRCGGGPFIPASVYCLHVMDGDGRDMRAISAFESFEWTPSIADDGRILYARWDYVDRRAITHMSLWSTSPDGTNPRIVFGNFTRNPHCVFEARQVPNSHKFVFTASAHHSIAAGSLVLLDADKDVDGDGPITRLTPEVCFPESEGFPLTYYASPWPLSERLYLCAWSDKPLVVTSNFRPPNPGNATGLYVYDAAGVLELLHRDAAISSCDPIPLRPRPTPPVIAGAAQADGPQEGRFLLTDVYAGPAGVARGAIKRLRIVAVPGKTYPCMNVPNLGVCAYDAGKFVLGTVPVEADGSAHFLVPAGVCVWFQALGADGRAIQTMRSATYVQPGQTLSCAGCHERRVDAPVFKAVPLAARREPSKISPGPEGSWPLRFDTLVQPVLTKRCVACHKPGGNDKAVAKLDLTSEKAYKSLLHYGGELSLYHHVLLRNEERRSVAGQCAATRTPLLKAIRTVKAHEGLHLSVAEMQRLTAWMDTYAQRLGSFGEEQEKQLLLLRGRWASLLQDGQP